MKNTIVLTFIFLLSFNNSDANSLGWERILHSEQILQRHFNYIYSADEKITFVRIATGEYFKFDLTNNSFFIPFNSKLNNTSITGVIGGNPYTIIHYVNYFALSSTDTNFIIFPKDSRHPHNLAAFYLFRSEDYCVNLDTVQQFNSNSTFGIEFDPENDSIVYVISDAKLYKSSDRGSTFILINDETNLFNKDIHIYKFNSEIIFTKSNINSLSISYDSGLSFTQTEMPYPEQFVYNHLTNEVYAKVNDTVYVANYLYSNNISWKYFTRLQMMRCFEVNSHNQKLYAGNNGGLYEYNFKAQNWKLYNNSFSDSRIVMNIFSHSSLGDTLVVTTRRSVFKVFGENTGGGLNVNKIGNEVPNSFSLSQNYPNPFNPVTKIKFSLPSAQFTKLKVYNSLGQEVTTLVNQQLQPGSYEYTFDASGLSSGVYFYRLEAGDPSVSSGQGFVETKKFVLMK